MFKKLFHLIFLIVLIFLVGGLSSVLTDNYIVPKLSENEWFSRFSFLKKPSENVTIIEKTEQVIIREDDSINEIASQAATAVVNIISAPDNGSLKDSLDPKSQTGTGVIVTSDGLIITHRSSIIEKKAFYTILTSSGRDYKAQLEGIDDFTNLAFLKVEATDLPVISLANSSDYHPGKRLIAIGNAFGEYQNRFATGLLSHINKTFNISGQTVASSEKLEGVFELDLTDQQKYLGGPIIDYNGEMVGLIGQTTVDNKTNYYLITANTIKNSIDLAIDKKLKNYPVLGVSYISLTKAYAAAHELDRDRGALIYAPSSRRSLAILVNSPADKAGLKLNDIIIAVDKQEINLDNPLANLINEHQRGDKIELLILRKGKEIKVEVQL